MPDNISFNTGANLGIPGLTACHAVFGGDAIDGQTLLIQGGAGTVGLLAVQLAKWGGAHVIATTSNNRMRAAQTAGADVVLDYQAEDFLLTANCSNNELEALIDKSLDFDSKAHKRIQKQATLFKQETELLWQEVKAIINTALK